MDLPKEISFCDTKATDERKCVGFILCEYIPSSEELSVYGQAQLRGVKNLSKDGKSACNSFHKGVSGWVFFKEPV
ncbi:unnamed protein product [Nippostrongylus brasiliensis]|uniref:MATH domain-containing protein n=1 Tax=Nippostrongylus brasiliensis TaxID=27835 RepID=A0A0N4YGA1_NIPBR|nr:unnamed protein product [Nippostrongylus brasiliensis]